MGDVGFTVEMPGGGIFAMPLDRWPDAASDISGVLPQIRGRLDVAMGLQFEGVGADLRDGPWTPLSNRPWEDAATGKLIRPGYRDWKTGKYADRKGSWWAYRGKRGDHWPKPLSLSGGLQRSFGVGDEYNHWRPYDDGFDFGSKHPLAGYHQDGTDTIPARAMLDWDTTGKGRQVWIDAIFKPLLSHVNGVGRELEDAQLAAAEGSEWLEAEGDILRSS